LSRCRPFPAVPVRSKKMKKKPRGEECRIEGDEYVARLEMVDEE
jgi:hypothetical protein